MAVISAESLKCSYSNSLSNSKEKEKEGEHSPEMCGCQMLPGMFVAFVSHQWLGFAHPDPMGCHTSMLRDTLLAAIDGTLAIERPECTAPAEVEDI